jgi:hypothetical protein
MAHGGFLLKQYWSSFYSLLFKAFVFSSQPLNLRLVLVDLPLLNILPMVLRHELVTDQGSRYEPHGAADERAYRGMTHSASNDGARSCTDSSTNESALLAFG